MKHHAQALIGTCASFPHVCDLTFWSLDRSTLLISVPSAKGGKMPMTEKPRATVYVAQAASLCGKACLPACLCGRSTAAAPGQHWLFAPCCCQWTSPGP
ncbi:hypothetical protein HaLaN_07348 [Haematococcus lacustris]|uniref:Uncharacterized protein n=1 Tax=Haematococcus lacustris TaxID=44745 RepID=A0A699Z8D3_HAELA|nr:hypothetical protein HaLaN_07348 [Haematococcus lacustris]